MAYKTKFRHVEAPKNVAEMDAFPKDANSLRSWGAAQYRELARGCPIKNRCYTGAAIYAGADMFARDVLGQTEQNRSQEYMMMASEEPPDRPETTRLQIICPE